MKLKDKVAIVTGASRGIGRATAIEFAREGAKVVVNYVKEEQKANEVVDKIKELGSDAIAVKADVSKPDEVKNIVKQTVDKFGRIDILVNNAGIIRVAPLEKLTKEIWEEVLGVNLIGAFLCAKEVVPHMKEGGVIVNVSSDYGIMGGPGAMDYCASKAGLINLTKSLAIALAPKIRVNVVAAGLTETDMTAGATEEHIKESLASTPLRRVDKPENVAKVILFLASDDSTYVTGETIVADGGYFLK